MDYTKAVELIIKAAIIDGVETTIRPAKKTGYETAIEINMRKGDYSYSTLVDCLDVKERENGEKMLMFMLKDCLFRLSRLPYDN